MDSKQRLLFRGLPPPPPTHSSTSSLSMHSTPLPPPPIPSILTLSSFMCFLSSLPLLLHTFHLLTSSSFLLIPSISTSFPFSSPSSDPSICFSSHSLLPLTFLLHHSPSYNITLHPLINRSLHLYIVLYSD